MTTTDLPPEPPTAGPGPADDWLGEVDGPDGLGPGSVDPRMRERWIEARRTEGRRRLWILSSVMAVVALVGIGYAVARSPLFGADTVTVRGVRSIPAAAVRSVARVGDGAPLLFLDTGAVARRVESLPAVDHAIVTTQLPTTVIITIKERQPVAAVRGTGVAPIAVVDRDGQVIAQVAVMPPGLPEVMGVGPVPPLGGRLAVADASRGLAAMSPQLRSAVRRLTMSEGTAIVRLARGSQPVKVIRFGRVEDMRRKSEVALAVMSDLSRRGTGVRVLDVSVPSAPATR